jgi:murein DD-endopeptidase MepM/ murein hydrolase activator NlpD
MTRKHTLSFFFLLLPLLLLIPGCKEEIVPEPYRPTDAHDAYRHSLEVANLSDTALGREWISISEETLKEPIDITLPLEEIFYISPTEAMAMAYRFEVKRGQKIELDVSTESEKPARLFIDCFRVRDEIEEELLLVASANESENHLVFEPRRDARYIIRLQPELLRGGRYKVTLLKDRALDFPVEGKTKSAILSVFGVPRDGGRRVHNGLDVFARRHTPVLAPSDAQVRRVGENDLGGTVIWLYDSKRSINMYFAHLQTQDVESGTMVKAGQQIGTVGNSGNARTTPPHLHFGIYARGSGAVDPSPYITKINETPRTVSADLEMLGQWARSKEPDISLRSSASRRAEQIQALNQYSPMKIQAAVYRWYRVLLPDGTAGFVYEDSIEPLNESLENLEALANQEVRETPFLNSPAKEVLGTGEKFSVLASYEGYWLIKTLQGNTGWMSIPSASINDK